MMDKSQRLAMATVVALLGFGAITGYAISASHTRTSLEYGGISVAKVALTGGLPSLVIPSEVNGLFLVCAASKDAAPQRAPICLTVEQLRAWAPR